MIITPETSPTRDICIIKDTERLCLDAEKYMIKAMELHACVSIELLNGVKLLEKFIGKAVCLCTTPSDTFKKNVWYSISPNVQEQSDKAFDQGKPKIFLLTGTFGELRPARYSAFPGYDDTNLFLQEVEKYIKNPPSEIPSILIDPYAWKKESLSPSDFRRKKRTVI